MEPGTEAPAKTTCRGYGPGFNCVTGILLELHALPYNIRQIVYTLRDPVT